MTAYGLFVARLPWTVCRERLALYFKKYGEIVSSRVAFDWNTGLSKGYGFVHFKEKESLDAALKGIHELQGVKIEVKPFKGKSTEDATKTNEEDNSAKKFTHYSGKEF